MVCVCHLPLSGARSPTPLQSWSQKEPFSGTFSPMNALWRRQFDIDENETNCVNYKYCLVDAPGVSNSCIDKGSQLQTSCADTLNRVYQMGTPNPVAQLIWVTTSTAVAKPCLGMHKLDNICSSSVYGLCVSFAPERAWCPRPCRAGPKKSHFRVLFRQWTPLASSIRHRWKRN